MAAPGTFSRDWPRKFMDMRLDLIIPILILLVGAVATLVIGIFLPRERQTLNAWLALGVMGLAAGAVFWQLASRAPQMAFSGSFAADTPALWTLLIVLLGAAGTAVLAMPVFRNDAREAEFYTLLLFATLGGALLAGAADVMEILLGVLLISVGSYPLVAYRRTDQLALEAVLKYYLIGALANIGLIYGLILLYGLSGSTLLGDLGALSPDNRLALALTVALVVGGLGFKGGYVPGHFWVPDTYQGTTVPVAAFLATLPKVVALLALTRLLAALPAVLDWTPVVAAVAAVTMTWGNLAAFPQKDVRRLLGYSSISQSGYLLMGVVALPASSLALPGLLVFFAAYVLGNLGAFAVLAASGAREIDDLRGLMRQRPGLALAMAVSLLSFMGLPPLAGFMAKFLLFTATVEAGYTWLTVLALANSVASLYYYLRVIGPMVVGDGDGKVWSIEPGGRMLALTAGGSLVVLGVLVFLPLDWSQGMRLLP